MSTQQQLQAVLNKNTTFRIKPVLSEAPWRQLSCMFVILSFFGLLVISLYIFLLFFGPYIYIIVCITVSP